METTVLSPHPVRFRAFKLIPPTPDLPGNGLSFTLQIRSKTLLRAQLTNGSHFEDLPVFRLDCLLQEAPMIEL